MEQAIQTVRLRKFRDGHWEPVDKGVIAESPVSLTVNGEVWLTFLCTPINLDALALGFLYNENLIQSLAEVASVRICPTNDNVDVWLNQTVDQPQKWRRTSGCTGGFTASEPEQSVAFRGEDEPVRAQTVQDLVLKLLSAQSLYQQVGGVHTSALSDGKEILLSAEDIGRHNTLDKLAGFCLLEGIPCQQNIVITTGRISSEMLQKSIRLGGRVVISRTSPSSLSVELAERLGVTLVGYAHRDQFSVYTHPERVVP